MDATTIREMKQAASVGQAFAIRTLNEHGIKFDKPYIWRLLSPIGALLASGRCNGMAEGKALAFAKLQAMGRKRGSVSVQKL